MAANAVHRVLQRRFVFQVMVLNVLLEIVDIGNWLGAVETFSRNYFAMLQLVLGKDLMEEIDQLASIE